MIWEKELKIAQRAALTAGHFLAVNRNRTQQYGVIAERDVKLKADQESEAIILDILTNACRYPILAEESGEIGNFSETEQPMWIVDPLDGTVNYSKGINFCCVSIAMYKQFNPILGVIYDFSRDELFSGVVEKGADCNGRNIIPSAVNDSSQSNTGYRFSRLIGILIQYRYNLF